MHPIRSSRVHRAARAVARRLSFVGAAALLAACGGSDAATGPGGPGGETPRSELPSALVGNWRYGVVSPSNFWDDHTGAYAGNAYGISDYYEFAAGGTYKRLTYIYTTTYSCHTQAWTEMQGTLTATGERFVLYPTQGRYKVASNCSSSSNYTRPMTAAELAGKQGEVWLWGRTVENGRHYLVADVPDGDDPAYYERQP